MLSFASEAPELQALKVRASSASVIGKYEIAILRTLGFAPLENLLWRRVNSGSYPSLLDDVEIRLL